jgi:hypothetical protein
VQLHRLTAKKIYCTCLLIVLSWAASWILSGLFGNKESAVDRQELSIGLAEPFSGYQQEGENCAPLLLFHYLDIIDFSSFLQRQRR